MSYYNFNKHVKDGQFPESLKLAKITPIYKSGNSLSVQNYRPISVLSSFSKIFERIIYEQLEKHLLANSILNNSQYGFLKNSSTLAASLELITTIKKNIDLGRITACVFIDLSKAFDSINHNLLLNKLEWLILPTNMMRLFKNYLKNRSQYVNLENVKSSCSIIKNGVPQGSLLGPLLFNFFINDLFEVQLNGKMIMYADDIALIYDSKDTNVLRNMIQLDLDKIQLWMNENYLKINELKTKYMIFTIKNKKINTDRLHLTINNHKLEQVNFFKYLGLWIDHKLNWDVHIQKLKEKLRGINFILYQMRFTLPRKIKFLIFHAHMMSSVRYLLPIWGFAYDNRLKEIHTLINKSIKTIKNLPMLTPTEQLYIDTKTLPLKNLIEFETILLIFKLKLNLIRNNYFLQTARDVHSYNTRSASNFKTEFYRTSSGQNNALYKGLLMFNGLPEQLKSTSRISIFKIKLKEHLCFIPISTGGNAN